MILLCIAIIIGAIAVCFTVETLTDIFWGISAAAIFLVAALIGANMVQENGRVELATDICYDTVIAGTDWQVMSVSGLRAAAAASTPTQHLNSREAEDAIAACYARLEATASTAG